jgi:hypothetical protein
MLSAALHIAKLQRGCRLEVTRLPSGGRERSRKPWAVYSVPFSDNTGPQWECTLHMCLAMCSWQSSPWWWRQYAPLKRPSTSTTTRRHIPEDSNLKLSHYKPWRRLGERRYRSYSFSTSALYGVSSQHHAPDALYPRGRDPRYPLYRRLGGPQDRSGPQASKLNWKMSAGHKEWFAGP